MSEHTIRKYTWVMHEEISEINIANTGTDAFKVYTQMRKAQKLREYDHLSIRKASIISGLSKNTVLKIRHSKMYNEFNDIMR